MKATKIEPAPFGAAIATLELAANELAREERFNNRTKELQSAVRVLQAEDGVSRVICAAMMEAGMSDEQTVADLPVVIRQLRSTSIATD
jgi:hypothetical protein